MEVNLDHLEVENIEQIIEHFIEEYVRFKGNDLFYRTLVSIECYNFIEKKAPKEMQDQLKKLYYNQIVKYFKRNLRGKQNV